MLQTDSETTIERNLSSRFMVQNYSLQVFFEISCSHKNPKIAWKIP